MIGLDSNVLIRYIVRDDEVQSAIATELIDGRTRDDPGFVSLIVLVETCWTLRRLYRLEPPVVRDVVRRFLEASELVVERADIVQRAVRLAVRGYDLADALIVQVAAEAGCTETVTFDKRASTLGGFRLLGAS